MSQDSDYRSKEKYFIKKREFFRNKFGDLKKVLTFAARLRKNGQFFEVLREMIEVKTKEI